MSERKKHIIDKHPEVKKYIHKLPEIINNPDIILADEPTGALDSCNSVQIMKLLKKISKEN